MIPPPLSYVPFFLCFLRPLRNLEKLLRELPEDLKLHIRTCSRTRDEGELDRTAREEVRMLRRVTQNMEKEYL